MSSVKVAVRVRPMNKREKKKNAECAVTMKGKVTQVQLDNGAPHSFAFDFSHWSFNKEDSHYATQEQVYADVGKPVLQHALDGYNACIFAYGQTGAGKSYTMMGKPDDPEDAGITPRLCRELFATVNEANENTEITVEVSYLEIYNEKVRDLLNPATYEKSLKVREHPVLGPYVEDLSILAVTSYQDVLQNIDAGNKCRRVAATNMNAHSSRSHAVFTIRISTKKLHTQSRKKAKTERVAKLSLVDLAGSERVSATGATGSRLREGATINQSLTALGKVISALADRSESKKRGKAKKTMVIPYRESSLTWLLKESLGGNSKTSMIAAISPASINGDETISTLRYADRAKQIICKAIVNEDPTSRMVRELQNEIERLQQQLKQTNNPAAPADSSILLRLEESEKLRKELSSSWEEKLRRAEHIKQAREEALKEINIKMKTSGVAYGVGSPRNQPHLVNLNELLDENDLLLYYIQDGTTRVSNQDGEEDDNDNDDDDNNNSSSSRNSNSRSAESHPSISIILYADDIYLDHCHFEKNGDLVRLRLGCNEALVLIDDQPAVDNMLMRTGMVVQFGESYLFRYTHPSQLRRSRGSLTSISQTQSPLRWRSSSLRLYSQTSLDEGMGPRFSFNVQCGEVLDLLCTRGVVTMESLQELILQRRNMIQPLSATHNEMLHKEVLACLQEIDKSHGGIELALSADGIIVKLAPNHKVSHRHTPSPFLSRSPTPKKQQQPKQHQQEGKQASMEGAVHSAQSTPTKPKPTHFASESSHDSALLPHATSKQHSDNEQQQQQQQQQQEQQQQMHDEKDDQETSNIVQSFSTMMGSLASAMVDLLDEPPQPTTTTTATTSQTNERSRGQHSETGEHGDDSQQHRVAEPADPADTLFPPRYRGVASFDELNDMQFRPKLMAQDLLQCTLTNDDPALETMCALQ